MKSRRKILVKGYNWTLKYSNGLEFKPRLVQLHGYFFSRYVRGIPAKISRKRVGTDSGSKRAGLDINERFNE